MKLIIVGILAFATAWLLCYGAMKTAERIATAQQTRMEQVQ